MPDDKQLKRISNLLNSLQVRTALESTNVSPQYLNNEIARRDAIKLEKQGNQIDPVTKKPKKYSEQWLQSTGQQIPGLDSEGTSAMNALDLIGLPGAVKIAGAIGREGIKRGIGRVATNIVPTNSANLRHMFSTIKDAGFKKTIKAIYDDVPLRGLTTDEVPYRMMFGLKPRGFTEQYAINPDGSIRFTPKARSYETLLENQRALESSPDIIVRDYVMGHYKHDPITGRYWDKWDVGLNKGELKANIKAIRDIKTPEDIYNLTRQSYSEYGTIPTFQPDKIITASGEINSKQLALEKTKAILRLLERAAVRKTVNYFSDPVVIQGTIKGVR